MKTVAVLLVVVGCLYGQELEDTLDTAKLEELLSTLDSNLPIYDVLQSVASGKELDEILPLIQETLQCPHHECKCENNACKCCVSVHIDDHKAEACLRLTHKGSVITVSADVLGQMIFSKDLPAEPTVCGHKKILFWTIEICARVYDISFTSNRVHACLGMSKPLKIKLACFNAELTEGPSPRQTKFTFEMEENVEKEIYF